MSKLIRLLVTAVILTAVSMQVYAADTRLKITLLSAGNSENQFWNNVVGFAKEAANDLDIELVVVAPEQETTYTTRRLSEQVAKQLSGGDFLIAPYMRSVTPDLLEKSRERGFKVFLINADVLDADRGQVGAPRDKYKNWIGHAYADDKLAGYLVADEIIKHFTKVYGDKGQTRIRMMALMGKSSAQASYDRDAGLKERIKEEVGGIRIDASENADWSEESAYFTTKRLIGEYPFLNAVWAASDGMAIGAVKALKEAGKTPGRDVFVAGVDWAPDGINAVQAGELSATVGGHFMDAGIAVLLIHDYYHGIDFVNELGTTFTTAMYPISQDNIGEYMNKIGKNPDWSKVNFKQFSKHNNKALQKYDFSWQRLVGNRK